MFDHCAQEASFIYFHNTSFFFFLERWKENKNRYTVAETKSSRSTNTRRPKTRGRADNGNRKMENFHCVSPEAQTLQSNRQMRMHGARAVKSVVEAPQTTLGAASSITQIACNSCSKQLFLWEQHSASLSPLSRHDRIASCKSHADDKKIFFFFLIVINDKVIDDCRHTCDWMMKSKKFFFFFFIHDLSKRHFGASSIQHR